MFKGVIGILSITSAFNINRRSFVSKSPAILMLIHQLSAPTENGKYAELQDQMHNMDSLMRIIINVYKENTNITDEDLMYLLQKDLWLNSTQCLKYGLIDEII
jgi:ATP-dependent protease ClpP protease subunit